MNKKHDNGKIRKAMLDFSARGLVVLPLSGKSPILKNWPNREQASAQDIDKWTKNPAKQVNVGMALGAKSGVVGIDVDGDRAMSSVRERSGGDLPDTWEYTTPHGHRFLYAVDKQGTYKSHTETFDGTHEELALMGDGRQTVVPPSTLEDGVYEWVSGHSPEDIELAPAPKWLLELMSKKSTKKPDKARESDREAKVFDRLESKCAQFRDIWSEQQTKGVPEETWWKTVHLLVQSGHPNVAYAFSKASHKHATRSEDRIAKMVAETGSNGGPMPRCKEFGCGEEQIAKCFSKLHRNDENEITNSPGAFIKGMKDVREPSDSIYEDYIEALTDSEYTIDDRGRLCTFDSSGNLVVLANFVARITEEITLDDGANHEKRVQVVGVLEGGERLNSIELSLSEFLAMNWAVQFWGVKARIKPGYSTKDKIRDAIQTLSTHPKTVTVYQHLGWRRLADGQWVFLHTDGAIGSAAVQVNVDRMLSRYSLPDVPQQAVKGAKASLALRRLAPLQVTLPLLALTYLTPLVEAFKQAKLEPNFVTWLYGTTGSRKTSVSLVYLSHFGDFGKSPPASFKDTANALERRAFVTKDTLLLIDD